MAEYFFESMPPPPMLLYDLPRPSLLWCALAKASFVFSPYLFFEEKQIYRTRAIKFEIRRAFEFFFCSWFENRLYYLWPFGKNLPPPPPRCVQHCKTPHTCTHKKKSIKLLLFHPSVRRRHGSTSRFPPLTSLRVSLAPLSYSPLLSSPPLVQSAFLED